MLNSLEQLDLTLKKRGGRLYYFTGESHVVVKKLIQTSGIKEVFVNYDYTPFSRKRDDKIRSVCKDAGVKFRAFHDALLTIPGNVLKKDETPYTVFTPFRNAAQKLSVLPKRELSKVNFITAPHPDEVTPQKLNLIETANENILIQGGTNEALKLLKAAAKLSNYEESRNLPAQAGTTTLSAHNKFGTLSVRTIYHTIKDLFGPAHGLINELYWRDFFTHIAWHFPHVFEGAFHRQYDAIEWENDEDKFKRWCNGETGFPIVDAGMRELNTTGFMHNRVRMIVASFLMKDLHIDWRWGEKYFAKKLIDYDPAVNNGNWQWAASTGCDAQPYFRIFNPWLQQEKFDADCVYIKRWVSELTTLSAKEIHALSAGEGHAKYLTPIIDHSIAKGEAEAKFRTVLKR